jgi:hypothetical protein
MKLISLAILLSLTSSAACHPAASDATPPSPAAAPSPGQAATTQSAAMVAPPVAPDRF